MSEGGLTPPRHPGHPDPLSVGDKVMLIDRKQRRFFIDLAEGRDFHFHAGAVRHDDLIGRPEGCTVRSTKGQTLMAVRPTAADWTVKAPRGAQVVYPKDQAMIVGLADIAPGVTVAEAGAGSGALTCALLRAVGERGRVVSFELRDDHADIAERNVVARMGGHPPNWELRRGDVAAGLQGGDGIAPLRADRIVLDLVDPTAVLDAAAGALHAGGVLLAYTPTIPQVMRLRSAVGADGRWGLASTVETLVRGWNVDGLSVRPDHRMVAHTAFLTTVRRMGEEVTAATSVTDEAAGGPLP